jgi:hypothetical protein
LKLLDTSPTPGPFKEAASLGLEIESGLATTILKLIRSDNLELKASTEMQLRHEIGQRRARFYGQKMRMQSCSGCGTKAVRGNTSLLPSLAGVKGPSGCAVRQNSKSDPVQGPVVLEPEERPIASSALWGSCNGGRRALEQR